MERDDKVEFTQEGYEAVIEALTFLPEEKRKQMLNMLLMSAIRV